MKRGVAEFRITREIKYYFKMKSKMKKYKKEQHSNALR